MPLVEVLSCLSEHFIHTISVRNSRGLSNRDAAYHLQVWPQISKIEASMQTETIMQNSTKMPSLPRK